MKYIVLGKNTIKIDGDILYSSGDSKMILSVPNSKADGYGYWNSANKVIIACNEKSPLSIQ